ncbi:hypothetical protein RHSIM_Rhsim02G0093200 [Rhododendron simsii]|uniref:Cytochrome b561 domain-containing protein n=1 Tax=Rhododendron simsii TaxID=118357 RepID=A0A834LZ65_RHOSS|nr:hypothetical protein RHSIM_Rhsim02G0093200 [Rhododendron simsii]
MMPLGFMAARYLKAVGPKADHLWFYVHITLQLSGYLLGMAGGATRLYLGIKSIGVHHPCHMGIGITLFCLGLLQISALFLRPVKDHKYRYLWNWFHHLTGYTVLLLSFANLWVGFYILKPAKAWIILYGIISGTMIVSTLALEDMNCGYALKKAATMRRGGMVWAGNGNVELRKARVSAYITSILNVEEIQLGSLGLWADAALCCYRAATPGFGFAAEMLLLLLEGLLKTHFWKSAWSSLHPYKQNSPFNAREQDGNFRHDTTDNSEMLLARIVAKKTTGNDVESIIMDIEDMNLEENLNLEENQNLDVVLEPKVGTLFNSEDEAKECYSTYAKSRGFGVVIKFSKKRDNGTNRMADRLREIKAENDLDDEECVSNMATVGDAQIDMESFRDKSFTLGDPSKGSRRGRPPTKRKQSVTEQIIRKNAKSNKRVQCTRANAKSIPDVEVHTHATGFDEIITQVGGTIAPSQGSVGYLGTWSYDLNESPF